MTLHPSTRCGPVVDEQSVIHPTGLGQVLSAEQRSAQAGGAGI
ncbi:hypothetical protein [Pseudomonas xionganensis]|nr:hypothetical protein [Pseudomonas xionganensis]